MPDWIADYHVQRSLDDPDRPGTRFVATPPPRLGLPEQVIVIEISPGSPADALAALTRWATAAADDGVGTDGGSGLAIPLEVGPDPGASEDHRDDDIAATTCWVSRRAALAEAGSGAPRSLAVLAGAASGLAGLHRAGALHGQVTPGRLLATSTGGVLDLPLQLAPPPPGLVTSVGATEALDTMAPEVARGEPRTTAADVWSLGACLYRALTGHLLHEGIGDDALLTAVQRVIFERPDVGPKAGEGGTNDDRDRWDLAAACLQPDPSDRPTAQDVAVTLARTLAGDN